MPTVLILPGPSSSEESTLAAAIRVLAELDRSRPEPAFFKS